MGVQNFSINAFLTVCSLAIGVPSLCAKIVLRDWIHVLLLLDLFFLSRQRDRTCYLARHRTDVIRCLQSTATYSKVFRKNN